MNEDVRELLDVLEEAREQVDYAIQLLKNWRTFAVPDTEKEGLTEVNIASGSERDAAEAFRERLRIISKQLESPSFLVEHIRQEEIHNDGPDSYY